MTSRERIKAILAGEPADRCGLWLGNPHEDALKACCDYFTVTTEEQLREVLGDDIRWIRPNRIGTCYHDPSGETRFERGFTEHTFGRPGPLADCEKVRGYLMEPFRYYARSLPLLSPSISGSILRAALSGLS